MKKERMKKHESVKHESVLRRESTRKAVRQRINGRWFDIVFLQRECICVVLWLRVSCDFFLPINLAVEQSTVAL